MEKLAESIAKLVEVQQESHRELMKTLLKAVEPKPPTADERPEQAIQALSKTFENFHYAPDKGSTFQAWYTRYASIFSKDAKDWEDSAKIRLIMRKLETPDYNRFINFLAPTDVETLTFVDAVSKLKSYFDIEVSLFNRRFNCLRVQRHEDEQFRDCCARVNKLAEDFELEKMTKDAFKCLLLIMAHSRPGDAEIRTRLLTAYQTKADITYAKLTESAAEVINLKSDVVLVEPESVHMIARPGPSRAGQSATPPGGRKLPASPCWHCGGPHFVKDCPFNDHTCKDCKRVGHKEGYCAMQFTKPTKDAGRQRKPASKNNYRRNNNKHQRGNCQNRDVTRHDDSIRYVSDVYNINKNRISSRKYVDVELNGITVTLQLDSGSDVTLISTPTWTHIGKPALRPTFSSPYDAQKNGIPILGEFTPTVKLGSTTLSLRCLVTPKDLDLLGLDWMDAFDLWKVPAIEFCKHIDRCSPFKAELAATSIKTEFSDVFQQAMGCCPQIKGTLTLEEGAKPVFRPKRNVPFPLLPQVEAELERLEQSGIITPVQFSDFAAPIVVVRKPSGAIRICGDYSTGLNAVLKPHHYPVQTPENIFASLAGASIFSKIDLSDAYLQLEMDDRSKQLLTINTHRGLFTFNRLCPGVKPASAIFQQAVDTMLAGLENVVAYCDDILIASKDSHDHLHTLRQVFRRLQTFNFRARPDKCQFFRSRVTYLGMVIDKEGQRPDPDKTKAIDDMPAPTNVTEVRAFLGAVGFYAKFINSMSDIRAPLDALLQKDAQFIWDEGCEAAFQEFKTILRSGLLLGHYDVTKRVTIASDASQYGIGGVAYHETNGEFKAFHYTSRKLTATEQRYSQIEKEALGIVHSVTKFRLYVLGKRFTLLTDHLPLLKIFGENQGVPGHVANRLRRWALTLSAFDFEIKFIGTNEFGHADVLSRLISNSADTGDLIIAEVRAEEEATAIVKSDMDNNMPVTFNQIADESARDPTLRQVATYTTSGWPPQRQLIKNGEVEKYFNIRSDISLIGSCVRFRDRTVVPPAYRRAILQQLHSGHPGIGRMKAFARHYVYWPNLDTDIEKIVKACKECAKTAKAPVKTLLSAWPTPNGPWQRVHADFAGPVNGDMYLVMIDAYSKWPEVFRMTSTTTEATTKVLQDVCARMGAMNTLVTDNGPQFTSAAFDQFTKRNAIDHVRTAPYHPQSNGLAERFVDSLKRALAKSPNDTRNGLREFLTSYRATPNVNAPENKSPAELLMGRRLRTPMASVLPPEPRSLTKNEKMEDQFNRRHGARRRRFNKGEEVYLQVGPQANWTAGRIKATAGRVMYEVTTGDGKTRRLHANQLRPRESIPWDVLTDYSPAAAAPSPEGQTPAARPAPYTRTSPPVLRPRPTRGARR